MDAGVSGSAVRVVVVRCAREALEREVTDRHEETGGMILGRWSGGRDTLVVTGFTGPGPKAVHRACHFSADPEYQQVLLDRAVERWGTGYVGEWHLHPGALSHPSEWDRQQVRALLEDATRPLDRLVVVIVNQDARYGVRVFPFLATLERGLVVFVSLAWDEVGLQMDDPREVEDRGITRMTICHWSEEEPAPVGEAERANAAQETAGSNGRGLGKRLVRVVGTALRRLGSGLVHPGGKDGASLKADLENAPSPVDGDAGPEAGTAARPQRDDWPLEIRDDGRIVPWYESAAGKQRLADEKRRLDRAGLTYQATLLDGGEIGFRFHEHGGGELVVVCREGFPRRDPRVLRRRGGESARWEWVWPMDGEAWREDAHLADVVERVLRARPGTSPAGAAGR